MSDQGKANYEAFAGQARLVGGHGPVAYEELPSGERAAWDAGADAVEAWLAGAPVDEDAPGNEPQPVTVIVVTEPNGRQVRYALPAFGQLRNGELVIGRRLDNDAKDDRQIEVDVMYPHGQWARVHKDGAEVPDGTKRALEVARRALLEILKRSEDGGEQPFGRPEIGAIANGALEDIWTETEL